MQLSVAVSNLRRLRETPPIKLRPITILVGRNSAGKSTFLRTFPLIRQSLETKSSAPILWYGDYVDFGNFGTAVSNKDINNKITISFKLEQYIYEIDTQKAVSSSYKYFRTPKTECKFEEVDIKLTIGEKFKKTTLEKVSIESEDRNIHLHIQEDPEVSIFCNGKINGQDIQKLIQPYQLLFFTDELLTAPVLVRRIETEGQRFRLAHVEDHRVFQHAVHRILRRNIFDNRIKEETIRKECQRILRHKSFSDDVLRDLEGSKTAKFSNFYSNMRLGNYKEERNKISCIIKLREILYGYDSICKSLSTFFESCDYIGPARARSERYYREQELEVSDISPDGKNYQCFLRHYRSINVANFLNGLKKFLDLESRFSQPPVTSVSN